MSRQDLDIDNSAYHNKPHPTIVYCISKNPGRTSHAMRAGLKDAVKCILRIGSAHNKGGGALDIKIAHISHVSNFL